MEREKLHTLSGKATSAEIKGDCTEVLKHSLMLTTHERTAYSHYRIVNGNELQLDTFISMKPYAGYSQLPFKLNRENIFDFVLNWYNEVDFKKIKCEEDSGGDGHIGAGFLVSSKDFGAEYDVSIKAIKIYYGK